MKRVYIPTLYPERSCTTCKKGYRPLSKNQKFCSDICRPNKYGIAPFNMKVCVGCGATKNLTVNHIKPQMIGTDNTRSNLEIMCQGCNVRAYAVLVKKALSLYFASIEEAREQDALSDMYESYKEDYEALEQNFDPYIVMKYEM